MEILLNINQSLDQKEKKNCDGCVIDQMRNSPKIC